MGFLDFSSSLFVSGVRMRNAPEIRARVAKDHVLVIGGPVGDDIVRHTFSAGETFTIRETTDAGTCPRMFVIDERPEVGEVSRGVLAAFLQEFDKPPYTKPGSS